VAGAEVARELATSWQGQEESYVHIYIETIFIIRIETYLPYFIFIVNNKISNIRC